MYATPGGKMPTLTNIPLERVEKGRKSSTFMSITHAVELYFRILIKLHYTKMLPTCCTTMLATLLYNILRHIQGLPSPLLLGCMPLTSLTYP